MRATGVILLLLGAVVASSLALGSHEPGPYHMHKVYRVVPRHVRDIAALERFRARGLDFWTKAHAVGRATDVQVPPTQQRLFETYLRMHGVKFVTLIDNLQAYVDVEKLRQKLTPRLAPGRIAFDRYHRYDDIVSYMQTLARDYPSAATLETIGKTSQGRDLNALKVSSGVSSGAPAIVIDCGIHAREWIAPAMCLYIMQELVENLNNRFMIESVDWYIVPVLNPDGYEYSHQDLRLWRKTRAAGAMCVGVDANRNWNFHWMETGASDFECDETYAGPAPASEPEVQALANFVQTLPNKQLYLTFHSYGNYLLYPWGWTEELPENADALHSLAVNVGNAIRSVAGTEYTIGSSTNVLYAAAGGSDDWMLGVAEIPLSYTVELPGGGAWGFDLPADQIDAVVRETWEGVRVYWGHIDDNFGRKQ